MRHQRLPDDVLQDGQVQMEQPLRPLQVLAISGSLRAASSNTVLLRAAAALAPAQVTVTLYDGLADLPHFNPDLDGDPALPPVMDFRLRLQAADGILISSPEYAHGVPGALKNALDWVVGSGEFVGKPVALIKGSSRGTYAEASLTETLTVMMAHIIPEASVTLSLTSNNIDEASILADPEIAGVLRTAIVALVRAIEAS